MQNFDPSKMDPAVLMEMSKVIQQLPPDKLMKMQSLMHNMMAGIDVRKEMEEFEQSLPPGFREKLVNMLGNSSFNYPPVREVPKSYNSDPSQMNLREARLTILRALQEGQIQPDEAERLLFPNG